MSASERPPLKLVDTNVVDAVPTRDPRALLERVFAPDVMHLLDQWFREIASELDDARQAKVESVEGKTWLTLRDAGELLGCTPQAVRMRVKRGRLEHRYHGRRLYVSARSVQELR